MSFEIKEIDEIERLEDLNRAKELLFKFYNPYKKLVNEILKEKAQVRVYFCDALIQSLSKDMNIPEFALLNIIEKIKADLFKEIKDSPKPSEKYFI